MTRITVASLLNDQPAPTAPAANTASTPTVPPGPTLRTTGTGTTAPRTATPLDPRGTQFGSRWLKDDSHVQLMQQLRQSGASSTDFSHIGEFCEFLETYKPQASSGQTVTNVAQFQALATPEIRRALVEDAIGRTLGQGGLPPAIRGCIQRLIATMGVRTYTRAPIDPYSGLSDTERPFMRAVDALPNLKPADRSRYKSFIGTLARVKPILPGSTRQISHIATFQALRPEQQQILLNYLDRENEFSSGMRAAVERVQGRLAPPPANSAT